MSALICQADYPALRGRLTRATIGAFAVFYAYMGLQGIPAAIPAAMYG
jgi:hypothetical protein